MNEAIGNIAEFDVLAAYLECNVEGFRGLASAHKFGDGQSNPTFLLKAESGKYVLRRQPPGALLKSAHAVDREYRVMAALRDSDVPVPEVLHLCEDRDVIGCLFFVMSYVSGVINWNVALPDLAPSNRTRLFDEMNRVLAALHGVDVAAAGLADFGKSGSYFERQISRWTRQYRYAETTPIPAMDRLIDWLVCNIPEDDGACSLIHGDYRLDNFIFEPDTYDILAVLDWELSTLGHPYADLAYQCMHWRMPQDSIIPGLQDVDRAKLGIPTELEYVSQYCERSGIELISGWRFYLAFSFFRFAAILQGVMKRAVDGNASSKRAVEYGRSAPLYAEAAIDVLDRSDDEIWSTT